MATTAKSSLAVRATTRFCLLVVLLSLVLFGSAGTFDYWQAKLYLQIMFPSVLVAGTIMYRVAPDLLERRLHRQEERPEQRLLIKIGTPLYLLLLLIPGLDRRHEYSKVLAALTYGSMLVVWVTYGLIVHVLLVNRFASRVIEVDKANHQKVITAGPYAWVRHPMYACMLPQILVTPLALGSWWALLPAIGLIPVLIYRLCDEEVALLADLEGYREYMATTRYRLIPGVY